MIQHIKNHIFYPLFILLTSYIVLNDLSVLSTSDDRALFSLLIMPDMYGTLILSYPMSFFLSNLYEISPNIQWYSIFLLSVMLLNLFFISDYLKKLPSKIDKFLCFFILVVVTIYILTHMSITIITLFTLLTALMLIKKSFFYFLFFIFFATLLRTDIAIISLPFIILGYLISLNKYTLTKKNLYTLLFFVVLLTLNIMSSNLDSEYTTWKKFNTSRAAIVDYSIIPKHNQFTPEQITLLKHWWVQDKELIFTTEMIETKPSYISLILSRLETFQLTKFINHRYKGILFLELLFILLLIFLTYKNKMTVLYLILLLIGSVIFLTLRDVDRVTVVLICIWGFIILEALKNNVRKKIFLLGYFFISTYYLYPLIIKQPQDTSILKNEALLLIEKSGKKVEASISFPTFRLTNILTNNILFKEDSWIPYDAKTLLPSGWLSRHKFFYKTHQIDNKHFHNYYEWLMDENTGFIGNKVIAMGDYADTILKMYDQKYLKDRPMCKHIVQITDESEHFSISKIKIQCIKDNNDSL